MQTISHPPNRKFTPTKPYKPLLPLRESVPLLDNYRSTVTMLIDPQMRHLCDLRRKVELLHSMEKKLIPYPHWIGCMAASGAFRLPFPPIRLPAVEISLLNQDLTLFGIIVNENHLLEHALHMLTSSVSQANDAAIKLSKQWSEPDFRNLKPLVLNFDLGAEAMALFSKALFTSTNIRVLDRKKQTVGISGLGVCLQVVEAESLDGGYVPKG
ncbi:hypothetical protein COT48_01200 [Candidatus Woesearchaeota archaeon CG08_land_8_20_14_0_20_47_9]|nr:MAG: hypothetical protein COT48_01200 [Candidatus Woesearchaeota archaeon CG08_land_8_20_14_0_20_47_9]